VKDVVAAASQHTDQPADQFETLTPDQVMALPTPEWLIKDILPQTGLTFVYGAPKSGKSFVVLDMALKVVNGQPWFGRPTKQGGVLYIAGEGAGGFKNRYKAWHQHNNTQPNAAMRLKPTAIDLGDDDDLVKLLNTVRAQINDAKLVVIDTLARATPGIDENDAASMGKVVQVCDMIWRELNVCVLLVHHSGKDEGRGMRGSSALLGAADAVLQVRREKDEDGYALADGRIRIDAMKDAEMGDDIYFKLEQVEWPDGLQGESSMVVVEGAEKAKPKDGWPSKDTCRDILRAISAAWEAGRPWSSQYQSRRTGMFAADLIKTQWNVPYKTADDMVLTWLQNGVLAVENYDTRNNKSGLRKVGEID
jgi:KaiC/GvpD/RAD55 family RecA-like ATPase